MEVYNECEMVPCDGWAADLGCDKVCRPADWPGRYGGRNLCEQCAERLHADNRRWTWLTR